jgi:hypothetical protein
MSDTNLRRILPESESIIRPTDKVIIETPENNTTVAQFGNIIFNRDNFELSNTLDSNITLAQQISSDIYEYVDEKTNTIIVPEVLCLYFKEFTNGTGVVIGQQSIATTNLSLNYFQVSTIKPFDPVEGVEFSVDASGLENVLQDSGINLSPGIYKIECAGAFTLAGPAGSFAQDGSSIGNGDRGYLSLELYKDTEPNESLLVSTPIVDYAPEVKITTKPETWCGTQEEWEFFIRNSYETSTTHNTYMYGFISICKTSNIKLKAHTAGSYIIGYPNPDSESDLPPSLYNPIQIIFEKITDNPFEFEINSPEIDILSIVPQTRVTTTTTTTLPPGGPTTTTTTTTTTTRRPPPRPVVGERIITKIGASSWIVPNGVTSVSIVAVGAGGGGAATNDQRPNGGNGGDLRWRNNIPVTPGSRIWVTIGTGGTSFKANIKKGQYAGTDGTETEVRFINSKGSLILRSAGGRGGRTVNGPQPLNAGNSTVINASRQIGGGSGGQGGEGRTPEKATAGGGGGGAGGYTGNGGKGGDWQSSGRDGRGGAGGGGSGGQGTGTAGGGGGGVGLFGRGINGDGGNSPSSRKNGNSGKTGSRNLHKGIDLTEKTSFGFNYGGGGGGKGEFMGNAIKSVVSTQHGGNGAVRIIWGPGRSFPDNAR